MYDKAPTAIRTADRAATTTPRTAGGREIETERVDGGVLVFADCDGVGRELVGFSDVESKSLLRESLIKRGLGVGAIHNLETYAPEEVGL